MMIKKVRGFDVGDIKPQTPIRSLDPSKYAEIKATFVISQVAPLVGMSAAFISKVCGRKSRLDVADVLQLLQQDAFQETMVPRSMVLDYLIQQSCRTAVNATLTPTETSTLYAGNALDLISRLPAASIQCVVTSTPYWGLRIYKDSYFVEWADGEFCPYGHEQTPEAFVRHTIEIIHSLRNVLTKDGSIWWNVMDSFNTRTQIRSNAVEALRAMQGKDKRSWADHEARRYSAGHSYLKDGEQCMVPSMIAERASRIGLYVKSVITWAKTSTLPEPQESRVSRSLEYVLHLTKTRAPRFAKACYKDLPATLGGRNNGWETAKLSDVWSLPTSSGRDGHGAQFPVALPARCIALTTREDDVVLDPFVGAGTSGIAARALSRRFIGIDVSDNYLKTASKLIANTLPANFTASSVDRVEHIQHEPDLATPMV